MFGPVINIVSGSSHYLPRRGLSTWRLWQRIMRRYAAERDDPARYAQRRREHARRRRRRRR